MAIQDGSLFGSLLDLQKAQSDDVRNKALELANLDRGRVGVFAAGLGGGMMGRAIGGALGLKSPLEQKQELAESILVRNKDIDFNDPLAIKGLGQEFMDAGLTGFGQSMLQKAADVETSNARATLDQFKAETEQAKAEAQAKKADAAMIQALNDKTAPVVKEMGVPGDDTKTQFMQYDHASKSWKPITDEEGQLYIKSLRSGDASVQESALKKAYDVIVDEYGKKFCDVWEGEKCLVWEKDRMELSEFFATKPERTNGFSGKEIYEAVQSGRGTAFTDTAEKIGNQTSALPDDTGTVEFTGQKGWKDPDTGYIYIGDNYPNDAGDPDSWALPNTEG